MGSVAAEGTDGDALAGRLAAERDDWASADQAIALREATLRCIRRVRLRSGAPGAVSSAADSADLLSRRLEVVDLAGRGSALRRRSARRAQLGNRRRSEQDVTIAGEVMAHLFASTTGSDADWIVKLIDVYPEDYPRTGALAGFQLMVVERSVPRTVPQELREAGADSSRMRCSSTRGACTRRTTRSRRATASWCRCRARGSRSSTATRRRSCRTSLRRRTSDFKAATHRVYRTPQYPSRVDVPVVRGQ